MPAEPIVVEDVSMVQSGPSPSPAAEAPAVVLWEAARDPDPSHRWRDDLSTLEAVRLLNEVRCFGRIPFQLVGRPLRRSDVGVLVEHGARIGLSMRLAPGPDPLREETAADLRDAGLSRVVLDGDARPEAALLSEVRQARTLGLGVHVSTMMRAGVAERLLEQGSALADAGVHVWTLAFPVADGLRGAALDAALRLVVGAAEVLPLQLEVAGAPQIVRILSECGASPDLVSRAPREGGEVLYIAADGSALPLAELPLVLGNVRHDDVVDLFRDSPVLCAMRDPQRLKGKCRVCEFVYVCGGSRARAHAATGDWLAPDPACSHGPASSGEEVRSAAAAPSS